MKTVAAYDTPMEAHLARAKLEGSGIDAELRDENFVTFNWLGSYAVGGVRVQVPDGDVPVAREILGLPPEAEALLRCPHCGSSDTHVRPLSVFGAICLLLKLPIPMTRAIVDCHAGRRTHDAPLDGHGIEPPPLSDR